MMALAVALGAACVTAGLFASYALSAAWDLQVPTGPLIVLLSALTFGLSWGVAGFRRAVAPRS